MERLTLDRTDLDILAILGRDCRTPYSSIGSQIGLTSKSAKARVKNMIKNGIIEKFVVRVNPAAFGYMAAHVSVRTNNGITKDDAVQRARQFGDIAYHVHQMGRVSAAGLIIKEPLDKNAVSSLDDHLKPATVSGVAVSHMPVSQSQARQT